MNYYHQGDPCLHYYSILTTIEHAYACTHGSVSIDMPMCTQACNIALIINIFIVISNDNVYANYYVTTYSRVCVRMCMPCALCVCVCVYVCDTYDSYDMS